MTPLVWLTLRTYRNVIARRLATLWSPTRLFTLGVIFFGIWRFTEHRAKWEATLRTYAPRGASSLAKDVGQASRGNDGSEEILRALSALKESQAAMGLLIALVLFAMTSVAWFSPVVENPLELTEAEAATLLPAPLPRWHVVVYKVARWQLPLLLHSVVLSVVLGYKEPLANLRSAIGIWIVVAAWRTHRGLVSLVRATAAARGYDRYVTLGLALLVGAALVAGSVGAENVADNRLLPSVLQALPKLADDRFVQLLFLPWLALTAPIVRSGDSAEWLGALPVALAGLAVVVGLVVWADRAFAEATAGGERVRRDPAKDARSLFRPGPVGSPAVALTFRQLAPYLRVDYLSRNGLSLAVLVLVGAVLPHFTRADVRMLPAILLSFGAFFSACLGPLVVRVDVRREMERLDVLRGLPVRGEEMLFALGAAGVLATLAVQGVLIGGFVLVLVVGFGFIPREPFTLLLWPLPLATALGVALCQLAALLFPTWVAPSNPRGPRIDAMGGRFAALLGYASGLAFLLIAPLVGALCGYSAAKLLGLEGRALLAAVVIALYFVGALELRLLLRVSRWAFDRLD